MPHLSIVVPVLNAENSLYELWQRLKLSIEPITHDFELLLIDDFSEDRSWEVICELAHADSRVKGLKLSRNFGQHYGITAGLDHCNGDWVVVMDCDLQDQPEEIPKLYQKAIEGHDIVLARRINRQDSIIRKLFSLGFNKIFNYISDVKYDGQVGNFRIISKKVVLVFCSMRENLRFFGGMISWMGYRAATIDVQHAKSCKDKSTYTFKKLWKLASDSIIAYSDKPLRLASRLGFLMSTLTFCYGSYLVMNAFIFHLPLPGWTSLIIAICFVGGVIIWMLGIIGIYLSKIFDEARKRPLYIIEEATY